MSYETYTTTLLLMMVLAVQDTTSKSVSAQSGVLLSCTTGQLGWNVVGVESAVTAGAWGSDSLSNPWLRVLDASARC